jgi:hypothetical protein
MIKNQGSTLAFGGILSLLWQNFSSKYIFYRGKGVRFHEESLINLRIFQKIGYNVPPALIEKPPERVQNDYFL